VKLFLNVRFDATIVNKNNLLNVSKYDFIELDFNEVNTPLFIFPKSNVLETFTLLPTIEIEKSNTITLNNCKLIFVQPRFIKFSTKFYTNYKIKNSDYYIKINENQIEIFKNNSMFFEKKFKKLIKNYKIDKKIIKNTEFIYIKLIFSYNQFVIILSEQNLVFADFICEEYITNESIRLIVNQNNFLGHLKMCEIADEKIAIHTIKKKSSAENLPKNLQFDTSFKFLNAMQTNDVNQLKSLLNEKLLTLGVEKIKKFIGNFEEFDYFNTNNSDFVILLKNDRPIKIISILCKDEKVVDIKLV